MPQEYKQIPMTHAFLAGLDALIKAQADPRRDTDVFSYDEATIERVIASQTPPSQPIEAERKKKEVKIFPEPMSVLQREQKKAVDSANPVLQPQFTFGEVPYVPEKVFASAEELQASGSELKLSLPESKALYAFAISVRGEAKQYGSTEGVTQELFARSWLEQGYDLRLEREGETKNESNRLQRSVEDKPAGYSKSSLVTVTSSLEAKAWFKSEFLGLRQLSQKGPVVKVYSQQRLTPVGRVTEQNKAEVKLEEKEAAATLSTKKAEADAEVKLEKKETAATLSTKKARADIERSLGDSQYRFTLRPITLRVFMDTQFWNSEILLRAINKLKALKDAEFTLELLYALIPCLCDPTFRVAFCEKLATRPVGEFERAVYWIRQCYPAEHPDRAAIEMLLVNAKYLERKIQEDPTVLGQALKNCSLNQYNFVMNALNENLQAAQPDILKQAYSSIAYSTRFINGCKNFANWLGGFFRRSPQPASNGSTAAITRVVDGSQKVNVTNEATVVETPLEFKYTLAGSGEVKGNVNDLRPTRASIPISSQFIIDMTKLIYPLQYASQGEVVEKFAGECLSSDFSCQLSYAASTLEIEEQAWESVLANAKLKLESLSHFTPADFYRLIPCLYDPEFISQFCKKLLMRSPYEYEFALKWIHACYDHSPAVSKRIFENLDTQLCLSFLEGEQPKETAQINSKKAKKAKKAKFEEAQQQVYFDSSNSTCNPPASTTSVVQLPFKSFEEIQDCILYLEDPAIAPLFKNEFGRVMESLTPKEANDILDQIQKSSAERGWSKHYDALYASIPKKARIKLDRNAPSGLGKFRKARTNRDGEEKSASAFQAASKGKPPECK